MDNNILIEASNLCLKKNKKLLIKNVSFKIEKGKKTFIIGQNGSGKTLLLRLLHGIISPTSGKIFTSSKSIQKMVFQKPILLRRTVNQHFDFVCPNVSYDIKKEWFYKSKLIDKVDIPARMLSGGEQQKLALIGAIANDPDILFLDEPTSNLDFESKNFVEKTINFFSKKGKTIIMTSHSKIQTQKLADILILIDDGQIKESSTAKSFFLKPQTTEGKLYIENS